jgi:abortive infection bacteriophage resistance protein
MDLKKPLTFDEQLDKLVAHGIVISDKEKAKTLENHLRCLPVLRNKCAHAARMYNTDFNPTAKFTASFLRNNL